MLVAYLTLTLLLLLPADAYHCSSLQVRKSWLLRVRDQLIETVWPPGPSYTVSRNSGVSRSQLVSPAESSQARYEGDLVLRFRLNSSVEAAALASACTTLLIDTWEWNGVFADLRLGKDVVPSLLSLLPASMQNSHAPIIHDLAQAVHDSQHPTKSQDESGTSHQSSSSQAPFEKQEDNIIFDDFQPLAVIRQWLRLLESLFPSHVRLVTIGLSYEGREIQALQVGVRPSSLQEPQQTRRTILVAANSHAREWISVSTVLYAAYQFLVGYGQSRDTTRLLEQFDFIFIPTINPDGYVYSWEKDRFWRKNRQPTVLPFCTGLDLDHSYAYQWRSDREARNPCQDSYGGEAAFEATEARALADWAKNETRSGRMKLMAFLDLHSYSQQVLYPYSFSCTSTPPSLETLEEVAIGLAKAIKSADGEAYTVTSSCEIQPPILGKESSPASSLSDAHRTLNWTDASRSWGGSGLDYFFGDLRVPYAYQIKLRDTGRYGFLVPKKLIAPTGREITKAIEYLARFIAGDKGVEEQAVESDARLSYPRVKKANRVRMKERPE